MTTQPQFSSLMLVSILDTSSLRVSWGEDRPISLAVTLVFLRRLERYLR
jgi:hypothetical protein